MSEQRGTLVTCDRCSETKFLGYLGEVGLSNYAGPGTRPKYEDLPKTWVYDTHFGHLCPVCAKVFNDWMMDFFGYEKYKKIAPAWKIKEEPDERNV